MATSKTNTQTAEAAGKEKTSFYIDGKKFEKLKYIAFMDRKTQTEVYDEAFTDYIAKWEKKNGPAERK